MKNRFFVSVLISVLATAGGLFAQNPPTGSPVATHGQLSVSGSQLVDKDGDPVQLRGMSLYWSMGPGGREFYNADAVKWLASDWKASVVRAAMGVEEDFWIEPSQQGYISNPSANKERVLNVVQGAREAGIYVIIDWHSHEAENYQNQAIAFFTEMAQQFSGVPNVIYEIYNEPIGSSSNPAATWQTIKPYMTAVINAIRAHDEKNVIIIGTPYYCQRVDVAADDPVEGDNLMYALHFYAATSAHRATLRNHAMYAMNKGVAIFVTEFGTVNAQGKGDPNPAETDIWMDFMDQFKISWANWSLSTVSSGGETASALRNGANATGSNLNWSNFLTASGSYIRGKLTTPPNPNKTFFDLNVTVEGEGTVRKVPNNHLYYTGMRVQLYPSAPAGWRFVSWSGDHIGTEEDPSVTVTRDMAITALFEPVLSSFTGANAARAARWAIRRANGAVILRGPSAGDVSLYDVTGRRVARLDYKGGTDMAISGGMIPSGNYLMVVRDKSTGREVYKAKLTRVNY